MPPKSRFTESDYRKVWEMFAEGKIFKEVASEMNLPTGTIYRLLQKATEIWGIPKKED